MRRARSCEFREGLLERIQVEYNWADVVISNGVINLCADKKAAFVVMKHLTSVDAGTLMAPERRQTSARRDPSQS